MLTRNRPAWLLIAVDDEDVRTLVAATLSYAGYFPQVSSNAEQAIAEALAVGLAPDLVIADSTRPGPSDPDVCRILENDARTAGTAVLQLSSLWERRSVPTGPSVAADDCLPRAIRPSDLLHRVRMLLGGTRAADAAVR
jgi:two-component system OmpR family response regulator